MIETTNRFYYGPAGWAYDDWKGRVYPARAPRGFHPLPWLARSVNLMEVNVTFYRPCPASMAASWVGHLGDAPDFRMIVKAWQRFTHDDALPGTAAAAAWCEVLDPLREAGRLLAILVQFPFRVRDHPASRARLLHIRDRLPAIPLATEFRHRSWGSPEALAFLEAEGFSFVNIDQPAGRGGLPPTSHATSALGYVRLHGRNARAWFDAESGRDARYDYHYPPAEIAEWATRIQSLRARTATTAVVGNNHYHGKAMAAVLSLAHAVTGEPVVVPEPMLVHFPELLPLARPEPGRLF